MPTNSLYREDYLLGFGLKMGDLHDDQFAHAVAEFTFIWGHVEYTLYLLMEAIDQKRAEEWIEIYFKTRVMGRRIEAAEKEIIDATSVDRPIRELPLISKWINLDSASGE